MISFPFYSTFSGCSDCQHERMCVISFCFVTTDVCIKVSYHLSNGAYLLIPLFMFPSPSFSHVPQVPCTPRCRNQVKFSSFHIYGLSLHQSTTLFSDRTPFYRVLGLSRVSVWHTRAHLYTRPEHHVTPFITFVIFWASSISRVASVPQPPLTIRSYFPSVEPPY